MSALREVEFVKWLLRGLVAALPALVILISAVVFMGDLMYAKKDDTTKLESRILLNEKAIKDHIDDDVHMPESTKRITFVTRPEWLDGRKRTDTDVLELKGLLVKINDLLMERLPAKP